MRRVCWCSLTRKLVTVVSTWSHNRLVVSKPPSRLTALGFCYLYFSNGDEEEEEEEQEEAAEEEADIASDVAKEKIQKTTAVLRQAVSDKIAKFTKQLWKLFYSRFHIFAVLALNIKFSIHSFIIQIIDSLPKMI